MGLNHPTATVTPITAPVTSTQGPAIRTKSTSVVRATASALDHRTITATTPAFFTVTSVPIISIERTSAVWVARKWNHPTVTVTITTAPTSIPVPATFTKRTSGVTAHVENIQVHMT